MYKCVRTYTSISYLHWHIPLSYSLPLLTPGSQCQTVLLNCRCVCNRIWSVLGASTSLGKPHWFTPSTLCVSLVAFMRESANSILESYGYGSRFHYQKFGNICCPMGLTVLIHTFLVASHVSMRPIVWGLGPARSRNTEFGRIQIGPLCMVWARFKSGLFRCSLASALVFDPIPILLDSIQFAYYIKSRNLQLFNPSWFLIHARMNLI